MACIAHELNYPRPAQAIEAALATIGMPTSALTSEVKVAAGLLKYHITGSLFPSASAIAAAPSITTWYEKKAVNVTKRWAGARPMWPAGLPGAGCMGVLDATAWNAPRCCSSGGGAVIRADQTNVTIPASAAPLALIGKGTVGCSGS